MLLRSLTRKGQATDVYIRSYQLYITFLRLAAVSPLCLALKFPAPGLLLSLSRHNPSDRHLSATSLRLYSNPPPLGSFLSLNSKGGQLNPPPPPGRAVFQPPAWCALDMWWSPLGATSRIIASRFRATGDGFLVWCSFPGLVHTESAVNPERVSSHAIAPHFRAADIRVRSFEFVRKVGSSACSHSPDERQISRPLATHW